MTEIAFHVKVPDKLGYSCLLLRKAYLTGAAVTVTGEPDVLAALDRLLWSFSPSEFVPHCLADASASIIAATPILLTGSTEATDASLRQEVLVNLGQAVPAEFERFERLIEVVALASDDAAAGRGRWKHYAARGYALTSHERARAGDSS